MIFIFFDSSVGLKLTGNLIFFGGFLEETEAKVTEWFIYIMKSKTYPIHSVH